MASRKKTKKKATTKSAKPKSKAAKRPAKPKSSAKKGTSKKKPAKKAPAKKKPAKKAPAKKKPAAKQATPAQRAREKARLKKEREREKAAEKKQRERDKAAAKKVRTRAQAEAKKLKAEKLNERKVNEQERREKAKARAQAAKERDKAAADKKRERKRALKVRAAEVKAATREKAKAKADKLRERARRDKEAGRERALKLKARDAVRKEKEKAKADAKEAKAIARAEAKAEREAERVRLKQERDAEKARLKAEREAEKARLIEEKRLRVEAERARKHAEREAYKKAKEAEREKLRAEKEAVRRALEERVARASGRTPRTAGVGRTSTSTRVYSPRSIPNQSGTSLGPAGSNHKFANLRIPSIPPEGSTENLRPATLPPPPPTPPPPTIEERYQLIKQRLKDAGSTFRKDYEDNLLMSWIYHDSVLEGVVYNYEELRTAIDPDITIVPDSSLQSVCDDIRHHKAAIELVQELGDKKRTPVTLEIVKRLFLTLHPEEGDLKTVKYRKDIPQHRLYFHEYSQPDKIVFRMRQVFEWYNGPEPKKLKSPLHVAAQMHYDIVRIFPFKQDSGKVARLLMNILLLRAGYPPTILHSTERQRYYDALKGSFPTIVTLVTDSMSNGLQSIEKKLDEKRPPPPPPRPLHG
ncbi:MAG: Fic family protein [Polyangiaceae bacterium]|nr:Fic family protein [Polyangiaceae bacterium]